MAAPHAIHGDLPGDTGRFDRLPEKDKRATSWRAALPDDAGTGACKPRAMFKDEAGRFVAGG